MINLKVWHEEHIEVKFHESDVIDATISIIRKKYKLESVDGIEKGLMYQNVEYATSHSWTEKENRGKPLPEQIKALTTIDLLKQLKKGDL